jgi:hypothetical protein
VYWVSEVILSPAITFAASQEVTPSALTQIHKLANEQCFIAMWSGIENRVILGIGAV